MKSIIILLKRIKIRNVEEIIIEIIGKETKKIFKKEQNNFV